MALLLHCCATADALIPDSASLPRVQVHAVRVQKPIVIDGILSEDVWHNAFAFTDFKQKEPDQGALASLTTEVRVAYDDAAIYVGARMYDDSPDSVMAILSRRDQYPVADWFGVFLDPYHDRRTGAIFAVSAGGSIIDWVLYNDDWDDVSWDGVWEGKAHVDARGWTAEFRIPYSQLRFRDEQIQIWGINFQRDIGRKRENNLLVYTPRNQSGFVSRFADLVGQENIDPPSRLEVLPYLTGKGEYTHPAPHNPFNNGSRYSPGAGADLKFGLGNNLTMNATINPDFGQVEVDPAVVNLSDVESSERDLESAQWVTSADDPTATATFGTRYLFANLDQHTLSANIRLNWTFSPTLSLQLFMQPLISSGEYRNLKELTRPRSFDFLVYGTGSSTLKETKAADGSVSFLVKFSYWINM